MEGSKVKYFVARPQGRWLVGGGIFLSAVKGVVDSFAEIECSRRCRVQTSTVLLYNAKLLSVCFVYVLYMFMYARTLIDRLYLWDLIRKCIPSLKIEVGAG